MPFYLSDNLCFVIIKQSRSTLSRYFKCLSALIVIVMFYKNDMLFVYNCSSSIDKIDHRDNNIVIWRMVLTMIVRSTFWKYYKIKKNKPFTEANVKNIGSANHMFTV